MKVILMDPTVASDEQLWRLACEGDREAFSRIVRRYQNLVCSIAYSSCGTLGTAEDMAQETFIAAWHRLGELREPGKLRQWLCGIVRNIAATAVRRELRRGGPPESLEAAASEASDKNDPALQAVTQDEEALLWRTLATLPENYREPLILFYREEHSVAEVARQLDLTEDNVKQRLSRGRALLRDELAARVESTLARSKPGGAFTAAVLVALPMLSGSTASAALAAGAAAKTGAGAATKGLLAQISLGMMIGPLIGLIFSHLGTKAAVSRARSAPEGKVILAHARVIVVFCFAMSIGLAAVLSQAGKLYAASAPGILCGVSAWIAALLGAILVLCRRMELKVAQIRILTHTTDEEHARALAAEGKALRLPKSFVSDARFLGLPLVAMAWGGYESDQRQARTACGWLALGDVAFSPFLALGGVAVAPIALGGITVGVLSLSIFWGVAAGVVAVGSLAFGWWSFGCAAGAVKCAVGLAAVARDYAIGLAATAATTGAAAREWLAQHWADDLKEIILYQAHWWILLSLLLALALRWRIGRFRSSNPPRSP